MANVPYQEMEMAASSNSETQATAFPPADNRLARICRQGKAEQA